MSDREEVLLEPGFVLHQRAWRNTSLIVDCLTEGHGRQSLVARGARRPGLRQNAVLQPFRRIRLSWIRHGEMGRLTNAEADGAEYSISGDRLLAAFYVNELILRLVAVGDPNREITNCYSSCLSRLSGKENPARALRIFELEFLDALGYRVDLQHDCRTGEPVGDEGMYAFEHEGGVTALTGQPAADAISGSHLISLREHRLEDAESLRAARLFLGRILHQHLGGRPLKTRQVLRDLVDRRLVASS